MWSNISFKITLFHFESELKNDFFEDESFSKNWSLSTKLIEIGENSRIDGTFAKNFKFRLEAQRFLFGSLSTAF